MNRERRKKLERDLWTAAEKLRANSDLKASEYSTPVLGLIFLKFGYHPEVILARRRINDRMARFVTEMAVTQLGRPLAEYRASAAPGAVFVDIKAKLDPRAVTTAGFAAWRV